jgi:hypothetical protein
MTAEGTVGAPTCFLLLPLSKDNIGVETVSSPAAWQKVKVARAFGCVARKGKMATSRLHAKKATKKRLEATKGKVAKKFVAEETFFETGDAALYSSFVSLIDELTLAPSDIASGKETK